MSRSATHSRRNRALSAEIEISRILDASVLDMPCTSRRTTAAPRSPWINAIFDLVSRFSSEFNAVLYGFLSQLERLCPWQKSSETSDPERYESPGQAGAEGPGVRGIVASVCSPSKTSSRTSIRTAPGIRRWYA